MSSFSFILAVLTFIRANEVVAISMCNFLASISDGSTRTQHALAGIMSALAEVAFLGLAIHLLDQVVSPFFFFLFETCADFVPHSGPFCSAIGYSGNSGGLPQRC